MRSSDKLPLTYSFLFQEKGDVVMKSFAMYTEKLCGMPQLVEINRFSKKSLTWKENKFFFIDDFNYHNCPLVIGLESRSAKNVDQVNHYRKRIFENMARNLNFEAVFYIRTPGTPQNNSVIIDYFISDRPISFYYYAGGYLMTDTIENVRLTLTVPYGEPYTQLEKFLLPFEDEVWMMFFLVLLLAYVTIFIVKVFGNVRIANYIFGENVSSPGLDIFNIYMGGGMEVLPRRNFARYILVVYILYCLIMR